MNLPIPEHPHKRRNLRQWRENRLRRLAWQIANGFATTRKIRRANWLQRALDTATETL